MGTEHITYRHFGSEAFHPEYFGKIINDPSRSKPYGGLWASRVDASRGWEGFCRRTHYQTASLRKHFDFTLLPDANVYTIRSMKDLTVLPMRETRIRQYMECACQTSKNVSGSGSMPLNWHGTETNSGRPAAALSEMRSGHGIAIPSSS